MRRMLIVLLAVGLLAGACGESKSPADDPKGALVSAFEGLTEKDGGSVTFSIQSDAASLVTLSEEGEGSPIDTEVAEKILSSSISLAGNNEKDPKDAKVEILVNIGGEDAIELRLLDYVLYLRAELPYIVETFGQDPAGLEKTKKETSGKPGFEFVAPLIDGEWIALQGLEEMQKAGGASPQQLTAQQQKLFKELTAAIEQDAKVTNEGIDDAGDHLLVSIPLRKAYEDFQKFATDLAGSLPTGGANGLPDASEIPDEDALIDMWVKDGELTQIEFDIVKNKALLPEAPPEGVEKVAFRLAFADFDGEVEVPEGATDVNLQQLMGTFLGGLGGTTTEASEGGEAGEAGEIDCSLYADAGPEVKQALVSQCPEFAN